MNNKILSLSNVYVKYNDYKAISDVNLNIYMNDFVGVIGPNGGGKTTLVKVIMGMQDHSGTVWYDDILHKEGGRKHIGYLPQINNFDPKFPISVSEVILSGLQSKRGLLSRYSKADKTKAAEYMELVGISELGDKAIGELSGGETQRALLCRALISEPKLLILDEPANFVDNKFEKELYAILRELNERMAIIMVSHDIGTITSVVKSIVCVNRHVHRHDSNVITAEQLQNYDCPIQLVYHGDVPHTVLGKHQ